MLYFCSQVVGDCYQGGFDSAGELLMLVQGRISHSLATLFRDRLQGVAQQHLADQKRPYSLVIGMQSWLFAAFRELKRGGASGGGTSNDWPQTW